MSELTDVVKVLHDIREIVKASKIDMSQYQKVSEMLSKSGDIIRSYERCPSCRNYCKSSRLMDGEGEYEGRFICPRCSQFLAVKAGLSEQNRVDYAVVMTDIKKRIADILNTPIRCDSSNVMDVVEPQFKRLYDTIDGLERALSLADASPDLKSRISRFLYAKFGDVRGAHIILDQDKIDRYAGWIVEMVKECLD